MTGVTLSYHISSTCHTTLKINFQNFNKSSVKKILTLNIFTLFKIKNYFSYKDPIPDDLKPFLVYKLTYTSCSSNYIGKTCCHFKTRIEEHIKKDNKSHSFKNLHSTTTCFDLYNFLKIIDKANSKFDLKIKEALHINWRKHNLNAQQSDLALTLSLWLPSSLFSSVLVFLCFYYFDDL